VQDVLGEWNLQMALPQLRQGGERGAHRTGVSELCYLLISGLVPCIAAGLGKACILGSQVNGIEQDSPGLAGLMAVQTAKVYI
jgi:hypothetical protein